jgi:hypothetical protein
MNSESNILNYSIVDLMEILSISDLNQEHIVISADNLINESIEQNNLPLAEFYEEAKSKLIEFIESYDSEDEENKEENEENEENKEEVYISDVKEGELNPLVNKTEKRFIVLDSQYLPQKVPKTNYVVNLSENIKRVLNIKLHSYSIPFNWYLISSKKRNNIFYLILDNNINNKEQIVIDDGNYNTQQIILELNNKLNQKLNISENNITYNANTGKIKLNLHNKKYNTSNITNILFFNENEPFLLSNEDNIFSTLRSYKNLTLGWILGFRDDMISVSENGNVSDVIPDLKGPKYLYLVIDDFKRNHTTNNLVTITKIDENISMPTYFTNNMPLDCNQETLTVLPSAPRTLTQAQIYTINEVMKNKNKTNYYSTSPNESDILAILPLKHNGLSIGDRIVETSGQLQDNKRDYNGPVDLDRIGVKLIDDTGFLVDLNGSDWTITLIYEYLYQY